MEPTICCFIPDIFVERWEWGKGKKRRNQLEQKVEGKEVAKRGGGVQGHTDSRTHGHMNP